MENRLIYKLYYRNFIHLECRFHYLKIMETICKVYITFLYLSLCDKLIYSHMIFNI